MFNHLFGALQRKRLRSGHRRARWRRKLLLVAISSKKRQSERARTLEFYLQLWWMHDRLHDLLMFPSAETLFLSLVSNPAAAVLLSSFLSSFFFLLSSWFIIGVFWCRLQLTHWVIQDKYRRKLPPKPKPRQFKSRNYHVSWSTWPPRVIKETKRPIHPVEIGSTQLSSSSCKIPLDWVRQSDWWPVAAQPNSNSVYSVYSVNSKVIQIGWNRKPTPPPTFLKDLIV